MDADELSELREDYNSGIGYGDVKKRLFTKVNGILGEPRERYNHFMANKRELDEILAEGESRAKQIVQPHISNIRNLIGIS